jgi:endonuclease/exonuclease/phosphatase (EEP) superfamily protein YafD
MIPVLRGLIRVTLLSVGLITALPLLWRLEPRFVALDPMAPQMAAAGILLAGVALLARMRRSAVLGIVIAAWNLTLIAPDLVPHRAAASAAAAVPVPGAPASPLRFIGFNVWYANPDPAAVARMLAQSDADLVGLVEVTPRIKAALARLDAVYPYRVDCIDLDPRCEVMLLSRLPLDNVYAGSIGGRYPYIAQAEIAWQGRHVGVAVTHLSWPFLQPETASLAAVTLADAQPDFPGLPRLSQTLQAANLAAHLHGLPSDLVLVGDFNSAAWSPVQRALRQAAGLENRGWLRPTWPSWAWSFLRLPIDQVFVRGALRVTDVRSGQAAGSDHLPIEAQLTLDPG